jgi:hypothetical protein
MIFGHEPIVEQCEKEGVYCKHVLTPKGTKPDMNTVCAAYESPESKWANGKTCPLATHLQVKAIEAKKMKDPLKASKMKSRKKR